MSKTEDSSIKPIKTIEYTTNQPIYDMMVKLPPRAVMLAPSGQGKTTLICNLLLNHYRNCFQKIYIWSPTMAVDRTWDGVKSYCKNQLKQVESRTEKYFYDTYDPDDMQRVIDTQFRVIDYMKQQYCY